MTVAKVACQTSDIFSNKLGCITAFGGRTHDSNSIDLLALQIVQERVVLNLAPLNVIIGRNGSGKSVISRLPLLLASGLKDEAEAPVDLFAGGVLHSSRYEDLIYERSAQPFELGAQIGQGLGSLRFITTLRFVIEKHTLAIERFELYEGEDHLLCQLEIDSPEELLRPEPRYRRQQPRGEATIQSVHTVHFEGLFPDWVSDDELLSIELTRIRSHFKAAFANPAYLGPFRSHANEGPTLPGQGIRVLGPRGERAGDMVADDKLRGAGELTRLVENWFEESMGGSRVTLKQNDRNPTLVVFDSERNIEVDLSETGAGFGQVLPVVVQTFARVLGRIKSPLLITEQPELHLHPAAHGAVGDLFITAVNNSTPLLPVIVLCETHSEQIVTRLRRRIAEGVLSHADVKIFSVAHQEAPDSPIEPVREIKLDRFGTPDAWPVGVFDEAFKDLVELRQAVREKQAD